MSRGGSPSDTERVYIDSPIFTEQDRDTFTYVSPILDFDPDMTLRHVDSGTVILDHGTAGLKSAETENGTEGETERNIVIQLERETQKGHTGREIEREAKERQRMRESRSEEHTERDEMLKENSVEQHPEQQIDEEYDDDNLCDDDDKEEIESIEDVLEDDDETYERAKASITNIDLSSELPLVDRQQQRTNHIKHFTNNQSASASQKPRPLELELDSSATDKHNELKVLSSDAYVNESTNLARGSVLSFPIGQSSVTIEEIEEDEKLQLLERHVSQAEQRIKNKIPELRLSDSEGEAASARDLEISEGQHQRFHAAGPVTVNVDLGQMNVQGIYSVPRNLENSVQHSADNIINSVPRNLENGVQEPETDIQKAHSNQQPARKQPAQSEQTSALPQSFDTDPKQKDEAEQADSLREANNRSHDYNNNNKNSETGSISNNYRQVAENIPAVVRYSNNSDTVRPRNWGVEKPSVGNLSSFPTDHHQKSGADNQDEVWSANKNKVAAGLINKNKVAVGSRPRGLTKDFIEANKRVKERGPRKTYAGLYMERQKQEVQADSLKNNVVRDTAMMQSDWSIINAGREYAMSQKQADRSREEVASPSVKPMREEMSAERTLGVEQIWEEMRYDSTLRNKNRAGAMPTRSTGGAKGNQPWSKKPPILKGGSAPNVREPMRRSTGQLLHEHVLVRTASESGNQLPLIGQNFSQSETSHHEALPHIDQNSGQSEIIHRTLLTEDGQKVNVDINLKIISPRSPKQKQLQQLQPSHSWQQQQQLPQAWQQQQQMPQAWQQQQLLQAYQQQQPAVAAVSEGVQYSYAQPTMQRYATINLQGLQPAYPSLQAQPVNQQATPTQPGQYMGQHVSQMNVAQPTPVVNRYRVLPPLGYSSDKIVDGGYLDQYRRGQERVGGTKYRQYTLEDYKQLKNEMRYSNIGTLGPDLDTAELREKREKVRRQQEYATEIRKRHLAEQERRQRQREVEPLAEWEESDDMIDSTPANHSSRNKQLSSQDRRKLALEYARNIPRPKITTATRRSVDRSAQVKDTGGHVGETYDELGEAVDEELTELMMRHEEEKRKVTLILRT